MLLSYLIKKKSYIQPDYYLTLINSSCEDIPWSRLTK